MKTRRSEPHSTVGAASIVLMAILWLLVSASTGQAATWQECSGNKIRWNSGWTNMFISTTSFPAGSAWDTRLQNAMWHWNNVKGAGFNFYVGRDTDGTHSSSNGVNEVYWSSTEVGSALAVTFSRYHCYWLFGYNYGLDEADIAFNSNLSWSTGSVTYSNLGSPYNFELVALHELGHALGLKHEDQWMATMNSYYPNSGPFGYYKDADANADDRAGIRSLYPDGTTETDVAGSAFKRTGTGTSGLVSSPAWAYRGTNVTIEFSFANLSTATQTFDIGFYLSTNDFISTSDTLLATNYGAWGSAGFAGTFSRTLYIPSWITPGTYYLGFLIDPSNVKAESNESNNNQPMPRTITIY
ncbi:MAG: matrixin family metalloprotease [Nitrospira sp.]|nr:matrixin family metalloprotease [Nitrospira sp.]